MCQTPTTIACMECGEQFAPAKPWSQFCCRPCNRAFNNRRAMRGAELLDVLMTMRFDRDTAREERAWQTLCSLASAYRTSDGVKRAGRRSWLPPEQWSFALSFGKEGDGR